MLKYFNGHKRVYVRESVIYTGATVNLPVVLIMHSEYVDFPYLFLLWFKCQMSPTGRGV